MRSLGGIEPGAVWLGVHKSTCTFVENPHTALPSNWTVFPLVGSKCSCVRALHTSSSEFLLFVLLTIDTHSLLNTILYLV